MLPADELAPQGGAAAPSLVPRTQLDEGGSERYVSAWPECLEATVLLRVPQARLQPPSPTYGPPDPAKTAERSARRRRAKMRRYCIRNKLDRLWTLTYADATWSYDEVKADLAAFFKSLRTLRGKRFPYLWVIERHPKGHGLHVHVAMRGFVRKSELQETWGHGIAHFSARRRKVAEAKKGAELAAYFAKELAGYLTKEAAEVPGQHFYDVAQGFQPTQEVRYLEGDELQVWGQIAGEFFGGEFPLRVWRSADVDDWEGPPVQVLYWYGRAAP